MYIEAERLRELLPELAAGETWMVPADAFTYPQLERLDEHSWLVVVSGTREVTRCVAVVRRPRIAEGTFAGGAAIVCHRDITHLLPRLGCVDGRVAEWAAIPRVLPPSDLDLLRYELSLADDDEPVGAIVADDERAAELRAAVWDDPLSDDARLVYADYLQDRGDPRGELIALQVGRERAGEHPSDRERQLLRRIAGACAEPLTPHLISDFRLRRGFLATCAVNDTLMPPAITYHPAWRTVEDLTTTSYDLLVSPHVRARRVGLGGAQLAKLVEHPRPLPFETVVGVAPLGKSQRGVWIEEAGWDMVTSVGALAEVRVLSVNPDMSGFGPRLIPSVLRSPLGNRLHQLDAFIELQFADCARWRAAFDNARTPLLTLRFMPTTPERGRYLWFGAEVLVALRRTARAPHLIVQIDDALSTDNATTVMRFVAQLSRGVQQAELHDFAIPAARIPERHATLLERMRAMFQEVLVQPPSAKPLTP